MLLGWFDKRLLCPIRLQRWRSSSLWRWSWGDWRICQSPLLTTLPTWRRGRKRCVTQTVRQSEPLTTCSQPHYHISASSGFYLHMAFAEDWDWGRAWQWPFCLFHPLAVSESTNTRVLYFSIFSMCCLIGLATWQVFYLRRFFKAKKLIE